MRPALALARREVRDIVRERTIVVAFLVQLFIAGFSTLVSVGLTALYDPGSVHTPVNGAIAYDGPGGFDAILGAARGVRLSYLNATAARQAFDRSAVLAVVQERIEPDGARRVSLLVADGEIQSTLVVTGMRDLLQQYERQLRTESQTQLHHSILEAPAPARGAGSYSFLLTVLLPLLLLTPVFLCGAMAADSLHQEIQTKTLGLLRSAPITTATLLSGKLLAPLALAPAQVLAWLGLLALNHAPAANPLLLLALAAVLTVLVSTIGFATTVLVQRPGASQAAYGLTVIALAAIALVLPRPPLNLVAAIATGNLDHPTLTTLAVITAFTAVVAGLGLAFVARRIRST